MPPQTLYASLPRYQYHVVPIYKFTAQPQIPQTDLEPPKPPDPEPENLPTIDLESEQSAVNEDVAMNPVPATVEDAPDADAGSYSWYLS